MNSSLNISFFFNLYYSMCTVDLQIFKSVYGMNDPLKVFFFFFLLLLDLCLEFVICILVSCKSPNL